jgi:hypothetical protein
MLNLAPTSLAAGTAANPPKLYNRQPLSALPKVSTCKVMAQVNGREVDCVVDTGASTSAITLDCLRRLKLDTLIDTTRPSYLNADGRVATGQGKVPHLVLGLGDFETVINPTVTKALNYNMLIGNDVLTRARAIIDYNQGKLMIHVDPTSTQEMDISVMSPDKFYTSQPPPHTSPPPDPSSPETSPILFMDELNPDDSTAEDSPQSNTPHNTETEEDDLSDLPELATDSEEEEEDSNEESDLPYPHRRSSTHTLHEFQVLAELPTPQRTQDPIMAECFPDDDAWADNRDTSLANLIDRTHLTEQQFLEAIQLLEDNRDVFCFHPSELGTCSIGSHNIDTGDAAPIKKPYYRMPFKKYEQLKEHVDRLLENGIIRPSNSPWAAPMHLVPKKGDDS